MTLFSQTPHESILLLNCSPSDLLTITFVFLMLTFNPIKTGIFLLSMSGGGGGSIRPDTLAANNFSTAHNSDSVFAQIDAKFIFQSSYILLVMIRLIAFKL